MPLLSLVPLAGIGPMGPVELLLILAVVIIIFGVGRLPEVGGAIGKGIREFRKASKEDDEPKQITQAQSSRRPRAAGAEPAGQSADAGQDLREVRLRERAGQPLLRRLRSAAAGARLDDTAIAINEGHRCRARRRWPWHFGRRAAVAARSQTIVSLPACLPAGLAAPLRTYPLPHAP